PLASNNDTILSLFLHSLARPKSEIFGHKSPSMSIFCGFISKCTIFDTQLLCKYSNPRATPTAVLYKFFQSIFVDIFSEINLSSDPLGMNS
ncbi:hypothetical protein N665_1301s0010, partial [Sinapis alba]